MAKYDKLIRVGAQIAHFMYCNPIAFSMVSQADFIKWVAAQYTKVGYRISADEIIAMYDPPQWIVDDLPNPTLAQSLYRGQTNV